MAAEERICLRDAQVHESAGVWAPSLRIYVGIGGDDLATLAIGSIGCAAQIALDGAQVKELAEALSACNEIIGIDSAREGE